MHVWLGDLAWFGDLVRLAAPVLFCHDGRVVAWPSSAVRSTHTGDRLLATPMLECGAAPGGVVFPSLRCGRLGKAVVVEGVARLRCCAAALPSRQTVLRFVCEFSDHELHAPCPRKCHHSVACHPTAPVLGSGSLAGKACDVVERSATKVTPNSWTHASNFSNGLRPGKVHASRSGTTPLTPHRSRHISDGGLLQHAQKSHQAPSNSCASTSQAFAHVCGATSGEDEPACGIAVLRGTIERVTEWSERLFLS